MPRMTRPKKNCVQSPATAAVRYWSSMRKRALRIARYGRSALVTIGGVEKGGKECESRGERQSFQSAGSRQIDRGSHACSSPDESARPGAHAADRRRGTRGGRPDG